jgi:hypothetical protein
MAAASGELVKAYQPLIGSRLVELAWMPITADTPDLVRQFDGPSFDFSGGVQLVLEPGGELFLTWKSRSPTTLEASARSTWSGLDLVHASMHGDWQEIVEATLQRVDLFTCPKQWSDGIAGLDGAPVGARHWLMKESKLHRLWVGTAFGPNIQEADDLWVGLDVDPDNLVDLEQVESVGD